MRTYLVLITIMSNSSRPPWTFDCQAPLSMEFPKQEHWSGLPFPFLGDLPNLGSNPHLLNWHMVSYHWATCPYAYECVNLHIISSLGEINGYIPKNTTLRLGKIGKLPNEWNSHSYQTVSLRKQLQFESDIFNGLTLDKWIQHEILRKLWGIFVFCTMLNMLKKLRRMHFVPPFVITVTWWCHLYLIR